MPGAQPESLNERIWRVVDAVPAGYVASYGQIADLAGLPRGARRVGRALGQVPSDREIPWYRILRASGKLAFDSGTRLFELQTARLQEEGVVILRGRINLKQFQWQPDMDELLWAPWAQPIIEPAEEVCE